MNVAVKLPNDLSGIIDSFAFLCELYEKLKKDSHSIHIITGYDQIEVLNLLPFKAFYHSFEQKDADSVLGIYRAYKNSKLMHQPFDAYFSLTGTKQDNLLGYLLKAKEKIGFSDSSFSFFLNKKQDSLVGWGADVQKYRLLKALFEIDTNNLKNYASKEYEVLGDIQNYIVLDSSLLENDDWYDFLNLFENQKVRIQGKDNKKIYKSIAAKNLVDIAKVIYYSKGYITNNKDLASIAAFVGVDTFFVSDKNDPNASYENFIGRVYCFSKVDKIETTFDNIWNKLQGVMKE
ncbi:MAG: hypothetical protein N4A33_13405 [Bacteriovoracaceae bacterium]|jgi:hypothetical protein|nr:hypothetical protein [Bacteriovoracaceae bacterium]